MHGGRGPGRDRRNGPQEKRLLLLGGLSALLLLVGSLIVFGAAFGVPVIAEDNPASAAIATPAISEAGLTTAAPGDILSVLTTPTTTYFTQSPTVSIPAAASPAATASAGPTLTAELPRAEFAISPQIGPPGTEITAIGQGWAPSDLVAIRLQDPANPQATSQALPLATADSQGSFQTNFTIPLASPWANLPAVLLWAVSSKTGIYSASPQPFVFIAAQAVQPQSGPAATATAPEATVSPTPSPTSQTGTPQSPSPTPSTQTPTPAPSAVQSQTPPPTPVLLPQAGAEPLAAATPSGTPGTPLPSPSPLPGMTATVPAETAPGELPRTGASVVASANVTSADAAMRAGPGIGYRVVLYLEQGSSLAIVGQNSAGDWLWGKTAEGVQGWVPREATDFSGQVPLAPGQR